MFSKTLTIERISFSIFLIIAGLFLMTAVIWSITSWLRMLNEHILAKGGSINYFFFLKEYHHGAIKSLLLIASGFLMISKQRIGWTIGIALCAYHCIFNPVLFATLLMESPHNSVYPNDSSKLYLLIIAAILTLLFLLTSLFLLFPKTRIQFNTTKVQYRTAAGFLILLIADKFIF